MGLPKRAILVEGGGKSIYYATMSPSPLPLFSFCWTSLYSIKIKSFMSQLILLSHQVALGDISLGEEVTVKFVAQINQWRTYGILILREFPDLKPISCFRVDNVNGPLENGSAT